MLIRLTLAAALSLVALPAFADDARDRACALQNDVVGAIQQARLDRLGKAKVVPTLLAANPDWPQELETGMPALVDWVYSIRRRDLRNVSLGEVAEAQCRDNWEQIQALTQSN